MQIPRFMRALILLCFLLVPIIARGKEHILQHEADILTTCFKTLLETSEAGYVICGEKPLCLIEYSEQDFCFELREFHRLSIVLAMAKEILQLPLFQSGNILFHFDKKDEMLLVINKKNFLNVVETNRILFQYVLGPTITAERLLEAILSSQTSFFETVKYDRVLIGIILGYGVQNALYQSRGENISGDLIHAGDLPPFTPYIDLYPDDSQKEDLQFYESNFLTLWGKERRYLSPSLGYTSLSAELKDIDEKTQISSPKLQQVPNFIFGCLKDSKESALLIADLEKTQDRITKLLQSKHLLRDVFKLIGKDELAIEKNKEDQKTNDIDLHLALAKLLRIQLKEYPAEYLVYFVEGLQGHLSEEEFQKEGLFYPHALTILQQMQNNLETSNRHFQKIKEDQTYSAVFEPYIYASILEQGTGEALQGQVNVLVDYEILDPKGKKLNSALCQRLNLRNVLPAFSYGMQGMKEGETRELIIHPSLAYGVHTLLDKGIYLTAHVKLLNIDDSVKQELPTMQPTDLSYILTKGFYAECEEKYKLALKCAGKLKREFLKECQSIDLDRVAIAFQSPNAATPLTREETHAINSFFWNLYFTTN